MPNTTNMSEIHMKIIPAIDLREGQVVRLLQGVLGTETTYYENPADAALFWEDQGATILHIVDLDAALDLGNNLKSIQEIIATTGVELQVGGGIRTVKYAIELIEIGVTRVVCGTSAVKDPSFVSRLAQKIGSENVVVALDHVQGKVAVKGWAELTNLDAFNLAQIMANGGAGQILFSSVEADGTFAGPDIVMTKRMVQAVQIPVLAAGGIRDLDDLVQLQEIGVAGVIIGKALYENKFTLAAALNI